MNEPTKKQWVWLGATVLTGVVGASVFLIGGEAVPVYDGLSVVSNSFTEISTVIGIGIVLGLAVYSVFGEPKHVTRPLLRETPPEFNHTDDVKPHTEERFERVYHRALQWFDDDVRTDNTHRQVAIYGYQAGEYKDLPKDVEEVFEMVIELKAREYALENACTKEEAKNRLYAGEVDDVDLRYISKTGFEKGDVGVGERFHGWISPKDAFKKRITAVLDSLAVGGGEEL